MAFSLPRSVVSSSRANIPIASVVRRSNNPLFLTPSLTIPGPNAEHKINIFTDEYLIKTRQRHSDFDSHSIRIDHRHAGQFLRWKAWNLKNESMLKTKMIKDGDFLVAGPTAKAEFPKVTHVAASNGVPSTSTSANAAELLDSRIFKLQLLESLSSPDSAFEDVSLGYRCRLVSIEDRVLPHTAKTTSKLFVRLYDDRFFPSPSATHGSVWYKPGDKFASAEDFIRSELEAYRVGNTARRWKCHGAFKFVLSRNGHWLNGLLWEDMGQ